MKSNLNQIRRTALICALVLLASLRFATAQGTAITYQGRLVDAGSPANQNYDLRFSVFDDLSAGDQVGGSLTNAPTPVTNGLFTVTLDFGAGVFDGTPRWLEIGVRTNGSPGPYTPLAPRQPLTPAPYAIWAANSATSSDVNAGAVVKSLNTLKDNVSLVAGTNVTITPAGNMLTIASAGVGGSGIWSVLNNNAYYSAGSVGIGTNNPQSKLSVKASTGLYGFTHTDGITTLGSYIGGSGSGASGGWLGTLSTHPLHLFVGGGQPSLTIDTTGDVGIGTFTPQAGIRLEVNGLTRLTPGGSGGEVKFQTPAGETGMTIVGNNRADVRFDGSTLKLLAGIGTGAMPNQNGILIGTNGNVSIGSGYPTGYKLDVWGSASFTDDVNLGAGNANSGLYVDGNASKTFGGTSWIIASDRRLKQDVRAYEPGLNEILQLRPVRFRYRDGLKPGLTSAHEEVGFIAQEVREVIPDAVTEGKDGYLMLKADPIHWAAINAIQELNTKLVEQRAELKQRETGMAELRARNDSLEKRLHALEQIIVRQTQTESSAP